MSNVYFSSARTLRWDYHHSISGKLETLLAKMNLLAVASAIHDAPAMIVCSHTKGHINSGYAGALKNLAMGCVSSRHRMHGWKKGRGGMHCHGEMGPQWNPEVCTFCEQYAPPSPFPSPRLRTSGSNPETT